MSLSGFKKVSFGVREGIFLTVVTRLSRPAEPSGNTFKAYNYNLNCRTSIYPLVVRLYTFWLYDHTSFSCTSVYHLVVRLSLCEINRHSVALCAVSRWTLGEAKSVTLRLWQFFSHPSFFRYIEGTYILYIYKLLYTTYRLKLAKNGVPPSKKNCHNCNCNVFE